MRKTLLLGLLAVLTLSGRPIAAPAGNDATLGSHVTVHAATLSINGTSTMHPYTVSTKALKVTAAIASAADAQGLLQPGALQGFELQIPVNSFTSDKDGLTKQMFKALKADKHPTITFRLDSYTVEAAGGATVKSKGTLTVAGVERPIDMAIDVKAQAGMLQVRGTRDLLMTEFGIKPPTMFMGMLKTDDKVTITFALQLALAAKASN
ncbi:MAG TPA: YceI family protein [Vicinamibacterales bacterium]|nr:YceI family protein [Vicinamibacterales bacterium]